MNIHELRRARKEAETAYYSELKWASTEMITDRLRSIEYLDELINTLQNKESKGYYIKPNQEK